MSALDYQAILDAVRAYGASRVTGASWFRDRYDTSVGNLPNPVAVVVLFGGIAPTEYNTGGRSRVLTVLLGVGARGKDWATQEANLLDTLGLIEYEMQPPRLAAPFFGLDPALITDVSMQIEQTDPDTAVVRLSLSIYNED